MKRRAFLRLAMVVSLVWSMTNAASAGDQTGKPDSPASQKQRQLTVTGVIEKVSEKSQELVIRPQTSNQIQTQASVDKTEAAAIELRINRKTKVVAGKLADAQPAKTQSDAKPAKETGKPQQEPGDQAQKPKQKPADGLTLSVLQPGQLVCVTYVEAKDAKPRKGSEPEKAKSEAGQAVGKVDEKVAAEEPKQGKGETTSPEGGNAPRQRDAKPVLIAVSVQILKSAEKAEQTSQN